MSHSDYSILEKAYQYSLRYLESLKDTPVASTSSLSELRQSLLKELNDEGLDPALVIDELVDAAAGGLSGNAGGRFFAWVIGGTVPAALAADWLTSTWDQNAALYACAPAAAIVEEACGVWLKQLLKIPDTASFALVTGCQMAHLTSLAAARHHLLSQQGWDVEEQGLIGAPKIQVLSSPLRHGSVERALRLLGLGRQCIVDLPTNEHGQLCEDGLEKHLSQTQGVASIILLQAGDINTGTYDSFQTLIPKARQYPNTWVHIDGAFGLWANATSQYSHFLKGAELADSWATDGHKWLNVPYDSGYAFVAHSSAHCAAMSHRADYLTHAQEARDQIDWNPEFSRRARGFATYAALRQLGKKGVADLVERCCQHAHKLVTEIGQLSNTEVLAVPQINQGVVRFLDPSPDATEEDHDQQTDHVISAVAHSGEALFSGTNWKGRRCMRVSVCGWQTTEEDIQRTVAALSKSNSRCF